MHSRFEMCKENNVNKLYKAIEKNLVDKMLVSFLKKFNKKKNFYTSSSCAGRIIVIGLDKEEQKKPNLFVLKEHRTVKLKEIKEALKNNSFEELWLKQDPFIFHIVAKDLENAEKILKLKTKLGLKRGGIFYIKEGKYLIELIGTNILAVPVKIDNKILFNNKQISIILKKANTKLKRNYKILKKLCNELLKIN